MVRKSERNRPRSEKGSRSPAPEKAQPPPSTAEKKKPGRPPKRRKRSDSESEPEPPPLPPGGGAAEPPRKEVGEPGGEVGGGGASSRRPSLPSSSSSSSRKLPPHNLTTLTQSPPSRDNEKTDKNSADWKEEPSFWGSEDSAPVAEVTPTPEPTATTWKIQSSNGSGGEIQKLKICRQRIPNDSTDSSSPAHHKDSSSPRKKKKSKHGDEGAESSGEISSSNEARDDAKPMDDPGSATVAGEPSSPVISPDLPPCAPPEPVRQKVQAMEAADFDEPEPDESEKLLQAAVNSIVEQPEEIPIPQDEVILPQEVVDPVVVEMVQEEVVEEEEVGEDKVVEEVEVETSSRRSSQDEKPSDEVEDRTEAAQSLPASQVETKPQSRKYSVEEEAPPPKSIESASKPDKVEHRMESLKKVYGPVSAANEVVVKEAAKNVEEVVRSRTKSETSDDGSKGEKKLLGKVKAVTSEDAMDEIAKKLNERAARKRRASTTASTEKSVEGSVSEEMKEKADEDPRELKGKTSSGDEVKEPKVGAGKPETPAKKEKTPETRNDETRKPGSPREEGELTPTPDTRKSKQSTTVIINRPKEVISQPTRLKRNTDEVPPEGRKRRIMLKSKPKGKEQDPINISSQSLMLLVPEVKTITPEQVASFPLDVEELTRFEMEPRGDEEEQQSGNRGDESPRASRKRRTSSSSELKPREVEIRVENDTRQVSKKKPITFESRDDDRTVGPKLPNQDNHRVVRKISVVSSGEEQQQPVVVVRKPARRSVSPSEETEVLFITNLTRPFTIPQLKELLARTGTIADNGFYIDKIKSKCYVKYTDVEMAVETRHALNGVRWPVNNPKTLRVEFVKPEAMEVVQKMAEDETTVKRQDSSESGAGLGWLSEQAALKPQRRVTTAVREWDRGKVGAGAPPTGGEERRPGEDWRAPPSIKQEKTAEQKRRPQSPLDPKYEPPARKPKKRDTDAPAKLLDDLFRKTKATPCIYWLPLTAAQIAVKEEMLRQHVAEHERRLAELKKSSEVSRTGERGRDRDKSRERRKK